MTTVLTRHRAFGDSIRRYGELVQRPFQNNDEGTST